MRRMSQPGAHLAPTTAFSAVSSASAIVGIAPQHVVAPGRRRRRRVRHLRRRAGRRAGEVQEKSRRMRVRTWCSTNYSQRKNLTCNDCDTRPPARAGHSRGARMRARCVHRKTNDINVARSRRRARTCPGHRRGAASRHATAQHADVSKGARSRAIRRHRQARNGPSKSPRLGWSHAAHAAGVQRIAGALGPLPSRHETISLRSQRYLNWRRYCLNTRTVPQAISC